MSVLNRNYPFVTYKSNINEKRYSRRAHSHREVSLGYIESGSTTITVDHQKYRLIPGDVVMIPGETVHLCVPDQLIPFKFQMFYFDSSWWREHFNTKPGSFYTLALPASQELKSWIYTCIEGSVNHEKLELEIRNILKRLLDGTDAKERTPDDSQEFIALIHRQIKEMPQISRTVDDMAEQAGLSKFSFIRRYAQRYGLTPHADLVNMRIQRAVLLFETELDMISIALDCGFADQSHFINQFKLYTGLRPMEYRSNLISILR